MNKQTVEISYDNNKLVIADDDEPQSWSKYCGTLQSFRTGPIRDKQNEP